MLRAVDIIRRKRDGHELEVEQIGRMVQGIATGEVADYQWSALLMAIVLRGMTASETTALCEAMMRSGEIVDLSMIPGPKIDKHSTGGVGDKTSLILAPIAAAAGIFVPMVSGRGLGHSGGTLDKLQAIPGLRVDLDLRDYRRILAGCGLVMIGQTAEIAPADKFLYALRDATATVESIPLIAASIMSKKLAEGIDGLVLDIKTGDGAFLPAFEDSLLLAETMCAIGRSMGKRVKVLITSMDQPLGRAVGNALEVAESIQCLRGQGPPDLMELSLELAAEMVMLGGRAETVEEACALGKKLVDQGHALERFGRMIEAQGGDRRVIDNLALLPAPRRRIDLLAPQGGFVTRLFARPIGHATMLLGAGRTHVDSTSDPAVGVVLHKKQGESIEPGEPLCTLHVSEECHLEEAIALIKGAFRLGDHPEPVPALIRARPSR
ncbi:MAG: thymidine phosphorylase [Planctomycetaceae bacterium]|nr:thymidine phosphorylase [Planctomycetaceae bacterium]